MSDNPEKYGYYPKDPKKLTLKEVLHKMRDFRLLFIFSIPLYLMWGSLLLATVCTWFIYPDKTTQDIKEMTVFTVILILSVFVLIGIYAMIFAVKKSQDVRAVVANTRKYLPQIPDSFTRDVEDDLAKGMPFLKNHNLGISGNYIIGNLTPVNFTPVIIPRSEIVEVAYEIYEGPSTAIAHNGHITTARNFNQNFYFRLRNGCCVPVKVNDKFNLYTALTALQRTGLKMVELDRNAVKNLIISDPDGTTYVIEPEKE